MATISVYNQCVQRNIQKGVRCFHGETLTPEPDLEKLFGEKFLVNQCQLEKCSEVEYRRHFREDRILRLLYLEYEPNKQIVLEK